jgi:DNA polymerase (family 10)
MENKEIARILQETADLMEIGGEDAFRIRSYRNAAAAIEGHPERIADLLHHPGRKVTDIPGIGKGLAAVLGEIAARGSSERRDAWLARFGPVALDMLRIQGLGPKSIRLILDSFPVRSLDDLETLAKAEKLRTLPRLGAKLEEKILRSIEQVRRTAGRFLLSFADSIAEELTGYLAQAPGVEQVAPAGSLRRGKETVGDLDLLVTGSAAPAAVLDRFVAHAGVREVLGRGDNKASVRFGPQGLQVDVRALPRESFGAALQYFTGSKEHNVAIRTRAVRMGLKLNEYGLFRADTEELIASETEEQVYAALALKWIPPEMRENLGEIELAAEDRLPRLVKQDEVRGDLHMHTRESDGRATLEEMAEAARGLGYEYIAITDHSKALAMTNGLDERRVVDFARRCRELNARGLGIHIFSGLECDILRDGAMDIAEDALAELDLVVGSVHSHLNLEPAEMTDRLLRALESPSLKIIGHPTGRLLLHRDGYRFDFERIAEAAVRRGVWLEINASPERLDLEPALLRMAKARGARFVIATDAHHPKHLAHMRYGVTVARRAWLGPDDILNTKSLRDFRAALGKS